MGSTWWGGPLTVRCRSAAGFGTADWCMPDCSRALLRWLCGGGEGTAARSLTHQGWSTCRGVCSRHVDAHQNGVQLQKSRLALHAGEGVNAADGHSSRAELGWQLSGMFWASLQAEAVLTAHLQVIVFIEARP